MTTTASGARTPPPPANETKSRAATETAEERETFEGVDRVTRTTKTLVSKEKASARYVSQTNGDQTLQDASAYTDDRALRTLESDTRESHPGCEALAEMFAASPAVGVEVVMKGGVKSIGAAIAGGSSAFVAGAFALLHMFAAADVTGRRVRADERVVTGHTCAAILGAMRRYHRNAAVQQWGGMALWALAKDNTRCKEATLGARVPGGRGTAAEILTNALRLHGPSDQNEGAAKALAGAIMTFASNSRASGRRRSPSSDAAGGGHSGAGQARGHDVQGRVRRAQELAQAKQLNEAKRSEARVSRVVARLFNPKGNVHVVLINKRRESLSRHHVRATVFALSAPVAAAVNPSAPLLTSALASSSSSSCPAPDARACASSRRFHRRSAPRMHISDARVAASNAPDARDVRALGDEPVFERGCAMRSPARLVRPSPSPRRAPS